MRISRISEAKVIESNKEMVEKYETIIQSIKGNESTEILKIEDFHKDYQNLKTELSNKDQEIQSNKIEISRLNTVLNHEFETANTELTTYKEKFEDCNKKINLYKNRIAELESKNIEIQQKNMDLSPQPLAKDEKTVIIRKSSTENLDKLLESLFLSRKERVITGSSAKSSDRNNRTKSFEMSNKKEELSILHKNRVFYNKTEATNKKKELVRSNYNYNLSQYVSLNINNTGKKTKNHLNINNNRTSIDNFEFADEISKKSKEIFKNHLFLHIYRKVPD